MADPTVTSHHAIAPNVSDGATVAITLDGREITVKAGQFLIAAAEDAGVFIPRFCYHPRHEAGRDVPDVPGGRERAPRCDAPARLLRRR